VFFFFFKRSQQAKFEFMLEAWEELSIFYLDWSDE